MANHLGVANMNFLKSKKGFNDVWILTVILAIFISSAYFLPIVTAEIGDKSSEYDIDNYERNIQEDSGSVTQLNVFSILLNMLKLGLWDIGDDLGLPAWLDLVYTLLGIVFIVTIARNIWIGGGS